MSGVSMVHVMCSFGDKAGKCSDPKTVYRVSRSGLVLWRGKVGCRHCWPCKQAYRGKVYNRMVRELDRELPCAWNFCGTFGEDVPWREASRLWNSYRTNLGEDARRRNAGPMKYMRVREFTKRCRIHFHAVMIFTGWMRRRDIEGPWKALCGRNWFSKARLVYGNPREAARYVAKYLSKDVAGNLAGGRQYTSSRGFGMTYWENSERKNKRKKDFEEKIRQVRDAILELVGTEIERSLVISEDSGTTWQDWDPSRPLLGSGSDILSRYVTDIQVILYSHGLADGGAPPGATAPREGCQSIQTQDQEVDLRIDPGMPRVVLMLLDGRPGFPEGVTGADYISQG